MAKYNEQKEAMPKAAFQFGVKMQDGRKTQKQNKDKKLTKELHKIHKIMDRKKTKGGEYDDEPGGYDEDMGTPAKRARAWWHVWLFALCQPFHVDCMLN